jgi:hypothetical protein
MNTSSIKRAVDQIVEDLCNRTGLENEWHELDPLIQDDIKDEWAEIIEDNDHATR